MNRLFKVMVMLPLFIFENCQVFSALDAYNDLNKAYDKIQLQDYQGAIFILNKLIKEYPNLYYAYHYRGMAKYLLQDYNGAINDYNQVLNIEPEYFEAYHNRALAKEALGDYKGAIEDYSKAIEIVSDNEIIFYSRGYAKLQLKDYEGAMSDYSKAIEINSKFAEAFNNRGFARHCLGDYQNAISDFRNAIELKPEGIIVAYVNIGYSYIEINDYDKAIDMFDKSLKFSGNENNTYSILGLSMSYYYKNELSNAQNFLKKAMEIRPELKEGIQWVKHLEETGYYLTEKQKETLIKMFEELK